MAGHQMGQVGVIIWHPLGTHIQLIIFTDLLGGNLGLINVYALNNPQRNVGCRNTWFLTFLHIAIWVFYVDIDTMELNCDKISTCNKMIFEKERLT
jgi:hypothetical protein